MGHFTSFSSSVGSDWKNKVESTSGGSSAGLLGLLFVIR